MKSGEVGGGVRGGTGRKEGRGKCDRLEKIFYFLKNTLSQPTS